MSSPENSRYVVSVIKHLSKDDNRYIFQLFEAEFGMKRMDYKNIAKWYIYIYIYIYIYVCVCVCVYARVCVCVKSRNLRVIHACQSANNPSSHQQVNIRYNGNYAIPIFIVRYLFKPAVFKMASVLLLKRAADFVSGKSACIYENRFSAQQIAWRGTNCESIPFDRVHRVGGRNGNEPPRIVVSLMQKINTIHVYVN